MVIALCVLGVVALLSTTVIVVCCIHSGNISRAEEEKFKDSEEEKFKDSIDKEFNKK